MLVIHAGKMWWLVILCALLFNNANGEQLLWPLSSSVTNLAVGPADTVHCRLVNPSGATAFDGFGQCIVNIDRVTAEHNGFWTMHIVQPNSLLAVEQGFIVLVTSTDAKPVVNTEVRTEKPLVTLTCRVVTAASLTACVFRDPTGRVLQARQGVSEDRYSFVDGSQTGVQSCGFQINGPLTTDLGLWRCDIQTSLETYYGHLSVLCPWAMQDPEIAASVVSEPTLTSHTKDMVVSEGDSVTMSCSVQSAIRYCYFRARNGTVFSVRPGMSSPSVEYAGAGLTAGECGARFHGLLRSDSGAWSCHVGFPDSDMAEQRVNFDVQVQKALDAKQYHDGEELVVEGIVFGGPALDYCRFVRIDGQGFTSEGLPEGYFDSSTLSQGVCKIRVAFPTIIDHHPWTVVAKVTGHYDELARSTDHILTLPPWDDDGPPGTRWWLYAVVLSVVLAVLLVVFSFKRNRRWATERATGMRTSLRNSLRKEPIRDQNPPVPA